MQQRRIWWIDTGLYIVNILLLFLGLYGRLFSIYFFPSSNGFWVFPLNVFISVMILGTAYFAIRVFLDLIFHTGRIIGLLTMLKALLVVSTVLAVMIPLLILAASKTADLIF